MTTFSYKAIPTGAAGAGVVSGQVEASSEGSVRDSLRDQGLIVIELKADRAIAGLNMAGLRRSGVRRRDTVWFFQTLRRLLASSVTIEQAISTMEELAPTKAVRQACDTTLQALRSGSSLAGAVEKTPGLARPQHLALLRVGHESGRLRHCVELIERSIETRERLGRTIVSRLTYPAILVVASIGAVWILTTFVIPRFAETLESAGAELPLPTRLTLAASSWLMWIAPAALVAGVLTLASRPLERWPSLRRRLDLLGLRLPIVRDLIHLSQGAVICDTLATMLEGGGDLLAGLDEAQRALTSPTIADRLADAARGVREGVDPGAALHEHGALPPEADALVRIGSRSGDLVGALQQAAGVCAEKLEILTERLLTLMEPAIILLLASMVGWIVYSLISGMLSINDLSAL